MRTLTGRVALTPSVAMNASMRSRARARGSRGSSRSKTPVIRAGEGQATLGAGQRHDVRAMDRVGPALPDLDVEGWLELRWRIPAGAQPAREIEEDLA